MRVSATFNGGEQLRIDFQLEKEGDSDFEKLKASISARREFHITASDIAGATGEVAVLYLQAAAEVTPIGMPKLNIGAQVQTPPSVWKRLFQFWAR